jgi:hypothetical protein
MLLSISWLTLILRIFFTHIEFVQFVIHVDFANFIIMVVGNLWFIFFGLIAQFFILLVTRYAKNFKQFKILEGIKT